MRFASAFSNFSIFFHSFRACLQDFQGLDPQPSFQRPPPLPLWINQPIELRARGRWNGVHIPAADLRNPISDADPIWRTKAGAALELKGNQWPGKGHGAWREADRKARFGSGRQEIVKSRIRRAIVA